MLHRKHDDESVLDALANNNNNVNKSSTQRWAKRAFQRRSSEVEVRLHTASDGHGLAAGNDGHGGPKSPTPSRRRSSSIAVARPTPDLHRYLSFMVRLNV